MIAMQSDNFEQNNLNLQSENYSEQPQNPEYVGENYNMYQQPYDYNNQIGDYNYQQAGNFDMQQNFVDPNQMQYMDPNQQGYVDPNMGYMDPSQMQYMDPSQMGYVDPNQQGYIDPNMQYMNPSQMQYMDPNQQGYVDPNMGYVDQQQTGYLDLSQMQGMDPTQMQYVDPNQMGYVDPSQGYVDQSQMMGYNSPEMNMANDMISEMTAYTDESQQVPTQEYQEVPQMMEQNIDYTQPVMVQEQPEYVQQEVPQYVEQEVPQVQEVQPVEPVQEEVPQYVEQEVPQVQEVQEEVPQYVEPIPVDNTQPEVVQETPQEVVQEVPQVVETPVVSEEAGTPPVTPMILTADALAQAEQIAAEAAQAQVEAEAKAEEAKEEAPQVIGIAPTTELIDTSVSEEPTYLDTTQMYANGEKPEYIETVVTKEEEQPVTAPEPEEEKYVDINPVKEEPKVEEKVETISAETTSGLESVSSEEYKETSVDSVVEETKPKDITPSIPEIIDDTKEEKKEEIPDIYKPHHIDDDDDDEVEAFDARPRNINAVFEDPIKPKDISDEFKPTDQRRRLEEFGPEFSRNTINLNPETQLRRPANNGQGNVVRENTNDPRKNILHREPNNIKLNSKVNNFQFDAVGGISKEGEEKLLGFVKVIAVIAIIAIGCYLGRDYIYDIYGKISKSFKDFYADRKETLSTLDELNNYDPEYYGGMIEYDDTQNVYSTFSIAPSSEALNNDSLSNNVYSKSLRTGQTAEISCSLKFGAVRDHKKAAGLIMGIVNFYSGVKSAIKIEYHNDIKWYVYNTKSLNAGEGKIFAATEKNGIVYLLQYNYITKENVALGGIAAREEECSGHYSQLIGGIKQP